MVVFHDLKGLLKLIIKWEKDLKDFYDVAEIALRNERSRDVLSLLMENHQMNLKVINDIQIENFGINEWVKYAPDHKIKDLIPIRKITRESTPIEIVTHILDYENKIKGFYLSISEKIVSRNEKELFDSFVTFKENQILKIKQLLDYL